MEAADSGSLLIRAPVSSPEDGEVATGGSAFSDEEDFFLSGEEEDGGENFEEVSKPAVLTKVASMPKAPVTVEEDDIEEETEANGHSNGEIPEESSDIAGNSNSPATEGDSRIDEKKKESDENINSLATKGDSKINETNKESDEDRSSLAVNVPRNSPSDELDKKSEIQVGLKVPMDSQAKEEPDNLGSSLKSEEDSRADEKKKESDEDLLAGSNPIAHETDEDEKEQIKLGSSSTATESHEQSLGIEAEKKEETREDLVSSPPITEVLADESKKDGESRQELGSSSPATESKKEESREVQDSSSPMIELREEVLADEIKRDEESRAEPVSPPPAEVNEESLAREADKEDESREIPVSSSLADETSKEEDSQEDPVSSSPPAKIYKESLADETSKDEESREEPVSSSPPAKFHEESLADEAKKEESSREGPVSSPPLAKVQEGTLSDETNKESQGDQISLSSPAEFHEESLVDETKKEEPSREGPVSSPSPAKFQEESLDDETNKEEGSREEPVSSSPPAKFLEKSLADETNVIEDSREDPVSSSPPANVHEESIPDEVNKEEESQEDLISPSPPSQLHEESHDNEAAKEIKTRDILLASPPAESLEGEKSDEANKEIKLQEDSLVDETVKDLVTSPPSSESHVLLDSVERTHALDEEETEEKRLIDEEREVAEDSKISAAEEQEDELIKAAIPSIENSDEDVGPIEEGSLLDGQIVSYSDEEDSDEENDGKELFDSAALTALLKAASGASSNGEITFTSSDGTRIFSVDRPAGLGSSIPPLKPSAPRSNRSNIFSPSDLSLTPEPEAVIDEEEKKLQENVDRIKIKFLRLVHRLGHSPEDRVVAQVLYRLSLAEGIRRGRQTSRIFSLENAKKRAVELEEEGKEKLDFSCTILLLGKTGVGKSSLVNSIFGEKKVDTSAFDLSTHSVKVISGMVDGVHVRVIDTPGLRPSVMDQATNSKILNSVKKVTKRCPPDIVLYVDRLDTQAWDFNDLPLLRSIATSMGSAVWFNAIVALTHGASAPPEGSTGSPLSYEVFVDQRSRVVQHAIRQAAGDMRLMNPVSLVENHPSCRRNREGQRILPNGLSWRSQLLLLCYSSKILSEANSILKLQDSSPSKLFGFRTRSPPLPFLLSSLLQSKPHPKPDGVDQGDSDFDLDDLDEEPEEEEDEYDRLPPFKPLRKAQLAKLTKAQKQAYFDEYEYRVKLLQKKQYKEELKQARERKKREKQGQDLPFPEENPGDYDDSGAPATIPVPLPDMVLPPSFDCDNPAFRYRFLEPSSQLLTRPVLDSHGWDHDCGYDGVSLEDNLTLAGKYPASVSAQITKDKKDFTIHVDSSIAAMHGENGSTLAGFDVQSIGKQLAYILRSETKFKTMKKNKTAAGVSVTFLGENIAAGMKVEDELVVGKRLGVAASAGTMRSKGDAAYGANVEIRLRDKEFPIGQDLSTLGLSLMRWRGDLALGANLQSQFSVGRGSKMAVRVGLNNKRSGQVTVKLNSSEQLQIALMAIVPVAASIYRSFFSEE